MFTEKELLQIKKEIETAKTEIAQLSGQEKILLQRLKDDWDCSSLPEAKKKLRELEEGIKRTTDLIEEQSELLSEKYVKN